MVPELFAASADQSVVRSQPLGEPAEHRAWLAADACPTASIGRSPRVPRPAPTYPWRLDGPVFDLGHTAESSFGASSYLVQRPAGNVMVDSPVSTRQLTGPLDDLGGIAHVLLTHRDDVADAQRWAERYGARVWIHADDRSAAPFATDLITGDEPTVIGDDPGLIAVPVPGHTRGSTVFVVDQTWAFTGDSLAWDHDRGQLIAFRGACWYSWSEQRRSLARLAEVASFEWVLPGHGARVHLGADDLHRRLLGLTDRMANAA